MVRSPHRLRRWLLGTMILLCLAGIAMVGLVTSQPGARLLFGVVLPMLPVDLSVEEVRGRLIGPLRLEGVELTAERVTVGASRIDLTWRPTRLLLERRAVIDDLSIDGLRIIIDTAASVGTDTTTATVPEESNGSVALPFPIEFERITVDQAVVSVPGAVLVQDAHAVLTGSSGNFSLDGGGRLSGPSIPEAVAVFAGQGSLEGITLEHFRATVLDGSVGMVGEVAWSPALTWDVAVEADSIAYGRLLHDPAAWPGRASANATSAGGVEGYQLEATVAGTGPRLPASSMHFAGRGTFREFIFDEARGDVLRGTGTIRGSVAWSPEVRWDVDVAIDSMRPGVLASDSTEWRGAVTVHGRSAGHLAGSDLVADVRVDSVSGRLRGQSLAGYVDGRIERRNITLTRSWATWGQTHIEAAGQSADTVRGRFAVTAPDLSDLHPHWTGSLEARGEVAGRRSRFRVDADLAADGIQVDSVRVAYARGAIDITVDSAPHGHVDLTIGRLSAGTRTLDSLVLDAEGTADAHRVRGLLARPEGHLALAVQGSLVDRVWRGELGELALFQDEFGAWELSQPVSLLVSDSMVSVDSLCVTSNESFACTTGTWHERDAWSASATIQGLPAAVFQPFLPDSLTIDGVLEGDVRAAAAPDGSLDGDASLRLSAGTIDHVQGGERRRIHFAPVELRSELGQEGLTAETSMTFTRPEGESLGDLSASLRLPDYRRVSDTLSSQPLIGRLDAQLWDVSLVRILDNELAHASGQAVVDLQFRGTVADPTAEGEARYDDGRIEIPTLGVTLDEIRLVARGDREGGLTVDGSLRSGEGSVAITGRSPVIPSVGDPATLTIIGERFQAVHIPEADVVISPDLELRMTRDSIDLTGTVVVPKAIIELTEVPAGAVAASDDVVFVDVDTLEAGGLVTITSSVRVVLGDSVSFRGFGFRADLQGEIEVADRPNRETTGTGTIDITHGRYRAYGQDLRIDRGRVIFNGPVDDPGLDIQAYREARDRTIAGLNIRGSLREPEVSVFSNPSMSQSEAMSYIVLGRPLRSGSASEQNRMSDAATGLGADMLAQSLGAKAGLEAGVEQGATPQEAALVAGTYLSPHLFVAYGVGLFDRINIYRVRYEFNRRWSVQAESSRESSADLFFTFERK